MLRLTWTQPEDLVPHALRAARLDGIDVDDLARRVGGGGRLARARRSRARRRTRRRPTLRALGRDILSRVDEREAPADAAAAGNRTTSTTILALARPVRAVRRAGADLPTGCTARGSGGRPGACSASRSRRSRARASGRSRRAPGTGRSPATSPRSASTRRSPRATRGTGAADRHEPRREHRRDAGGRRPQLPAHRARPPGTARRRVHHRRRRAVVARQPARRPGVHRGADRLPQPPRRLRARRRRRGRQPVP